MSKMLKDILSGKKLPIGITHIFGGPNTGKTTLIYQLSKAIKEDRSALIFDCELKFSALRFSDIINQNKTVMNNILIIQPKSLQEQFLNVMKLHKFLIARKFSFIAINGVTDHIRGLELFIPIFNLQKLFSTQLAYLKYISHKFKIPTIITNQITQKMELETTRNVRTIYFATVEYYADFNISIKETANKVYLANLKSEYILYKIEKTGIKFIEKQDN